MSAIDEVYKLLWYSTSKKDRKLANKLYDEVYAMRQRIAQLEAAQHSVHTDEANESLCVCGKPINRHNGVACLPEPPRG